MCALLLRGPITRPVTLALVTHKATGGPQSRDRLPKKDSRRTSVQLPGRQCGSIYQRWG